MTPPHSLRGSGAALFALVALVWAPTLANGFVWDDLANLVRSARLGEWSALYEVFAHDAMWSADAAGVGTYRPLALASMVVDRHLYGAAPWGYHLSSLLLHAATAVMVFLALARFVHVRAAWLLAAVWSVHPTTVEVAAWINGRSESFALLFGAAALWVLCVEAPSRGRLARGGVLLTLAMLGKETGAIFAPGAVLLVAEAQRRAGRDGGAAHGPTALVAVAAGLVYLAARAAALSGASVGDAVGWEVLAVLPAVWWRAIQAVALPIDRGLHNLSPWLTDLGPAALLGYTAASLVAAGLAFLAWRRGERLPALGLAWWCASLAPVALLAVTSWPGFHRWLYIGLPGLLLAVYSGALEGRRAAGWVCALALLGGVVQTQRAIPVWRTSGTLFVTMVTEQPSEPYGYHGLGEYLRDIGDYAAAETVLRKGIALGAPRFEMYVSLASVLAARGRCAEAADIARRHVPAGRAPPELLSLVSDCSARGPSRTVDP